MKKIMIMMLRAIPFSVGLILSLAAVANLAGFAAMGYNYHRNLFLLFITVAAVGIPLLVAGIQYLTKEESPKTGKAHIPLN